MSLARGIKSRAARSLSLGTLFEGCVNVQKITLLEKVYLLSKRRKGHFSSLSHNLAKPFLSLMFMPDRPRITMANAVGIQFPAHLHLCEDEKKGQQ